MPIAFVVVYSSLRVAVVECEVCVEFGGRESCRKVKAQNREEALRSAIDNACAALASGMNETLRCTRTVPKLQSCRAVDASGENVPS